MFLDNYRQEVINNPKFIEWFDYSSFKCDNGFPTIFYHKSRSKEKFTLFRDDINKNQFNNCKGFYFVPLAYKNYIQYIADGIDVFCFLKMKNPLYIFPKDNNVLASNGKTYSPFDIDENFIKNELGEHDGLIIKNSMVFCGVDEFVVFDNKNIFLIEDVS